MSRFFSFRRLMVLALLACGAAALIILVCDRAVEKASRGKLYANAAEVPARRAALVLGTSRILPNGRENLFFRHRMDAAAELFKQGKCQHLIVSGDNSNKDYDEPTDMQEALKIRGIPVERIYRDFAGFRTLDSVVRAREIFGQEELIVVSQPFHNKRAIFLAASKGMGAVGLNCQEAGGIGGARARFREYFARVRMVLDLYLFRTGPKFLGPRIELGTMPPQHGS